MRDPSVVSIEHDDVVEGSSLQSRDPAWRGLGGGVRMMYIVLRTACGGGCGSARERRARSEG